MGLFSGIKNAAKRVKKAVKKGVTKVANEIAEVIETGGNKAQDIANDLAGAVKDLPFVGAAMTTVLKWGGGVVSGVTDLLGAGIRGIGSIIVGVVGGVVLVVGGILAFDFGLVLEGLSELGNRIIGAALIVLGKVVSLLQTLFYLEGRKRALSEKEVPYLKRVFRESVNLYNVRVIPGRAGLFMNTDRPFTLGNTIYMKNTVADEWNHVLVHETTHAWQYQNVGPRYSVEALWAQKLYGNDRAYNWQLEAPKEWVDFNREAQASLIEHIFQYGTGRYDIPPVGTFDMPAGDGYAAGDYTHVASLAIDQLRARGD